MDLIDPFFYYGNNVLIVRNTALEYMNHLQYRLKTICESCNFKYIIMTPVNECFTVLYINSLDYIIKNNNNIKFIELFNHPSIMSFIVSQFQIVDFKNHGEIYSVCTLPSERQKGNVRQMLSIVTKKTTKIILWLGVALDNPMFENVVKLYASFGFCHPFLTMQSLSLKFTWKNAILSLLFIKPETNDEYLWDAQDARIVLQRALRLRNSYIEYMNDINKYCFFSYQFPDQVLQVLEDQLRNKVSEVGGPLHFINNITIGNNETLANISIPLNEVKIGLGEPNYMVNPDLKGLNVMLYHTHPNIINMSEKVFVTWPSGADMAVTIHALVNNQSVVHMVATQEGIYTINLTHEFISYLSTYVGRDSKCLEYFYEYVNELFKPIEQFRSEGVVEYEIKKKLCTPEQIRDQQCPENPLFREYYYREIKKNYFLKVNEMTINTLIQTYPTKCVPPTINDFQLFEIDFSNWRDMSILRIYYSQIFIPRFYLNTNICPIIDSRKGDIYP